MDTTDSKIISIFTLLLGTLIFGTLPLLLISRVKISGDKLSRFLELANLFAGGVFLATLLLHLMPEANETLKDALENAEIHTDYPVSEIIVAGGFFLIAFIEQIAFSFHHKTGDDCSPHGHSHESDNTHDSHGHQHTDRDDLHSSNDETTCLVSAGEKKRRSSLPDTKSPQQYSKSFEKEERLSKSSQSYATALSNSCSHNVPVVSPGISDHVQHDVRKKLTIRSIIFFLALSIHSLFEGVAIGLQRSVDGVFETLLAVTIHKVVIAFSFTLSMIQQQIIYSIILFYVMFLTVVSPIGISIGILISESDEGTSISLANGILQNVAAGTFLFVIFFEILPRELHCHRRLEGVLNLMVTFVGFGLMAGLQAVVSHDHDDHEGNQTGLFTSTMKLSHIDINV